jgi:membrane associated rhomboid family serine protease
MSDTTGNPPTVPDDGMESPRPSNLSDFGATVHSVETEVHHNRSWDRVSGAEEDANSPTKSLESTPEEEQEVQPRYTIHDLVKTLGNESSALDTSSTPLPVELEHRVRDFRLAQQKRRELHGIQKRWGIFGMYAHLASVRTDLEWAEDGAWRRLNGKPYLSWKDFDQARHQGANRPWFTYTIIFICSVMMVVVIGLNGWKFAPLDVNPLFGPSAQALLDAGARQTALIVDDGQWFRIFTPIFLHAGLVHYGINMLAFWFIGGAIEETHGIINTIVLFFIPGIGGNILGAIFLPQYVSVGASGGIFGLIGGCLADIFLNWNILFIKEYEDDTLTWRKNAVAIAWLVLDIVINVVLGLTPYIDNFTHLGGLVYGLLCGFSMIEPLAVGFFGVHTSPLGKLRKIIVRFMGLILSVFLIVITTIVLATSDVGENPCQGCRYISCVPFPWWKNTDERWWSCDDCPFVEGTLYNTNGDMFYDRVDLVCPNDVIEQIDVSSENLSSRDEISKRLPSYCRARCEDKFQN